ncbi:MAG: hypothetical protein QE263_06545 [Vampirovibrionales bacterium]|nr:hypothetical protein [Vampirovibrionales bacterium]
MIRIAVLDNFSLPGRAAGHGLSVIASAVDGMESKGAQARCVSSECIDLDKDGYFERIFNYDLDEDGDVDAQIVGIQTRETSKDYNFDQNAAAMIKRIDEGVYGGSFDFLNCSFGKNFSTQKEAKDAAKTTEWMAALKKLSKKTTVFVGGGNCTDALCYSPENYLGKHVIVVNDPKQFHSESKQNGEGFINIAITNNGYNVGNDEDVDVPFPPLEGEPINLFIKQKGNSFATPKEMGKAVINKFDNPKTKRVGVKKIVPPPPVSKPTPSTFSGEG